MAEGGNVLVSYGGQVSARGIVRTAPGPALATDSENRVLASNRAARELFGIASVAEARGRKIQDLLGARDVFGNPLPDLGAPFFEMVSRGEPVNSFEVHALASGGRRIRLALSVVVVVGRNGEPHELAYLLRPVLRRRRADEVIERLLAVPAEGHSVLDRGRDRASNAEGSPEGVPELTRRQRQVLRLLAAGLSNQQIAKAMGISVNTVRSHIRALLNSLGVHSQIQAVARAFRDNLI